MANEEMATFNITLLIGGMLVSGVVISPHEFYAGLAEVVRMRGTGTGAEGFSQVFTQVSANLQGEMAVDRIEAEVIEDDYDRYRVRTNPLFIHLRDTRFHHPAGSPLPGDAGVFWRGRLTAVDGFFLGALG